MNRILLSAALLGSLLTGCGQAALVASNETSPSPKKEKVAIVEAEPAAPVEAGEATPRARAPGDFVVHRFSGTFRRAPLTMTQRVVAREGDALVLDVTLEDGATRHSLRVRASDAAEDRGAVLSVARVVDGVAQPMTIAAYDQLLASTALAADQNEALLETGASTLTIGKLELDCRKTSYRVRVGGQVATLQTLESDDFSWGDLGGEITSADGKVLYRAEVVEIGHAAPASAARVAQTELDEEE